MDIATMDIATMDIAAMDIAAMDIAAMDIAAMDIAAMDIVWGSSSKNVLNSVPNNKIVEGETLTILLFLNQK